MKNWKVQAGLLGVVLLGMVAFLVFAGGKAKTDSQPEQKAPPPRAERQEPTAPPPQEPEVVVEPEPIPEPEPELKPEPEPEPEDPSGLVIVKEQYSNETMEYLVFCFNPDTKKETLLSDFVIPRQTSDGDLYLPPVGFRPSVARWMFSDDYTRIKLGKQLASNGEQHAGWWNLGGSFTDVTVALGLHSKSDFDDPVSYSGDGFAGELFGYTDNIKSTFSNSISYYVPVDHLSIDAVQEGNVLRVGHPYNENGTLLMLEGWTTFGKYYASDVTSWIDDTHAIVNWGSDGQRIYGSAIADTAAQAETSYIPGDSRNNWNGVVSPDGTKIAFMSMPRKGEPQTDIYIVPVKGGDPVKLEGHPYDLKGTPAPNNSNDTRTCTLIDWI